jgi:triosephosphate isomerase
VNYVIANWKQNKTLTETTLWCEAFSQLLKNIDLTGVLPIVCPPAPFLEKMYSLLKSQDVHFGVQDISSYEDGAHTGFVGTTQIRQFCTHAIVGHSERHESRDLVIQKAKQCLSTDIVPIVCFKTFAEYEIVKGAIYALEDPDNISVGGVYRPKNSHEVGELVDTARKFFGQEATIIYGGSVNGENAKELASIHNLDGVLVGNASLNPAVFADILGKFS